MPDPERFSRLHAIYETVQGLPDAPGWLALPFPAEPPAPGGELPSGPGPASSAPQGDTDLACILFTWDRASMHVRAERLRAVAQEHCQTTNRLLG